MKSALVRWADLREQRAGARPARPRPDSDPPAAGFGATEDPVFLSLSPERAKVLLVIAARASSFTVVAVVALVLLTLTAAGSGLTGASGAIASGWLAIHQVPVVVGRTELGLLPLVPTGLVLWLTMRDCAHAVSPRSSRADLGWIVGAALAGPLLVTAVFLAVAEDAAAAVPLQSPHTLTAFGCVGGLHLLAAVVGIASRPHALRDHIASMLPEWVFSGARVAARALWRLVLCGAVLTVVSFVVHWSAIGDTYAAAGNLAGVLGLTVLSLAYVPNVAIAATSVLVGADVHIGVGSLSVFSVSGAPVPALPVLASVPTGPAAGWWPVLLLVPAVIGVRGGLESARESTDAPSRPWSTVFAAAVAAVVLAVLGVCASGRVGSFGEIGPGVLLTLALSFAWLTVGGYAGLVWGRRFLGIPPAETGRSSGAGVQPAAAGADSDEYAFGEFEAAGYAQDAYGRGNSRALSAPAHHGEADEPFDEADDPYDDASYDDPYDMDAEEDDEDDGTVDPPYFDQLFDNPRYVEYEFEDDGEGPERYPRPAYRRAADPVVEVDGELVDEDDDPMPTDPEFGFDSESADILDAEVVEGDLPDRPGKGGR